MKRAVTFWQGLVLFLVLLMTIGIYTVLGLAVKRVRQPGPVVVSDPISSFEVDGSVQIVEPLAGATLQRSDYIQVQAALLEPGLVRADLLVDERSVGVRLNSDLSQVPWVAEWNWEQAGEGAHILTVQARDQEGSVQASESVSVTIVPTGSLVFATNRDGAYAIYGMQTDGKNVVRLTSGPGDARQPAVHHEGKLAFVVDSESGQSMIRLLAQDSQTGRDLVVGRDPAWSPSGLFLAYSAGLEGTSQIFTTVVDAGISSQVTAEDIYAGQPAWAPDGTRLAYVAERDRNWDIWVAVWDGSEPRRLTKDPAMDRSPTWAPDGTRLAFVSDRAGSHQIYTMRADGADVQPLTDFPQGAEAPVWSPDGFWLAFVAYAGTGINAREIYLIRADGQNLVRLTHNSFDDTDPAWTWGP